MFYYNGLSVGDKVRCVREQTYAGNVLQVGYTGVVTHLDRQTGAISVDGLMGYEKAPVFSATAFEKLQSEGPKVPAYAVLKEGVVRWITTSRDEARGVKAVLGGKAEGAVLYKLTIEKEVR